MINKTILLSILTGTTLYSANVNAELYFSQDSNANGLYEINVSTGAATLVGAGVTGVTGATVGLAPSPNSSALFGSRWATLLEIQTDGSASVDIGGAGHESLAYCSSNSTLYGAINGSFSSINQATGANIAALSAPGFDAEGLACDSATNTIFAIGDGTDLRAYDIGTDTWSTVGSIGVNLNNGGLAWDPVAGVLYAIGGGTDNLYRINPTTAAITIIGPLGISWTGGLAIQGALPVTSPQEIPTLSFWGLITAILGLGLIGRRRKNKVKQR